MRALLLAPLLLGTGCASIATGMAADALSSTGGSYGKDDDPELIEGAIPFGLKTMESVLEAKPEHVGLLLSLASGFTQYGYAFVGQKADEVTNEDLTRGQALLARARKLYLRGRGYAFRALDVEHEGASKALQKGEGDAILAEMEKEEVPLLYWTAASWGLAISASKSDTALLADFPTVVKIAERALALDEGWNRGALHELFITLESSRPGGSLDKAKEHFERALALSGGTRVGPYLSYAEGVSVKKQDARTFQEMIDKALAVDLEKSPDDRLANTILQRRARRLMAAKEDLFLGEEKAP